MLPLGTDDVRALLCACLGDFVQDASRDMLRRSVMVRCGHPLACRTRNAPAARAAHLGGRWMELPSAIRWCQASYVSLQFST